MLSHWHHLSISGCNLIKLLLISVYSFLQKIILNLLPCYCQTNIKVDLVNHLHIKSDNLCELFSVDCFS